MWCHAGIHLFDLRTLPASLATPDSPLSIVTALSAVETPVRRHRRHEPSCSPAGESLELRRFLTVTPEVITRSFQPFVGA